MAPSSQVRVDPLCLLRGQAFLVLLLVVVKRGLVVVVETYWLLVLVK
jgi:hypothetical protein